MCYRYVDDIFVIFEIENDCDKFLHQLNSLHPSLRFTFKKEINQSLPFLNVQVEKVGSKLITSICRKLTFTEQYLNWKSFSPGKRKISLISTFVHRALMICSDYKLQAKHRKIFSIPLMNGYPDHAIEKAIACKLKTFTSLTSHMVKKCPVYLHLP